MPEKRKGKKVGDLKAQSVDREADKVKGGAEPINTRRADPINSGPQPSDPINTSKIR